ncbi:hypothetical protein KFE25_000144 [Diacronema lutheri]|uniref:Polygalacturonase n=2 Tax=Diacronema lutheri TaxID=2081491 RepID=A0A8J5X940_DIALT|nr:hypothetical protein KFE25_000144 [Diacronema lutheri]
MDVVDAAHFEGECGDERVRRAVAALGARGGTVRLGSDGPDDASLFASADRLRARRAWGWRSAVRLPSNVTLLLDGAYVAILPPNCTRPVRASEFPGTPRGFVLVGHAGALLGGELGAANVRVVGRRSALVDGCAPFFYGHPHVCHNSTCHGRIVPAADTRPPAAPGGVGPQLVRVYATVGFELSSVSFAHTASWVAHLSDVRSVRVHGVIVRHAVRDGLHFGPGLVHDVSVSDCDLECDDNNFALLAERGAALDARNVRVVDAVLRNGRTDAIRVGSCDAAGAQTSSIRDLRFERVRAIDLKLLASLGLPDCEQPVGGVGVLSNVLFDNVTLTYSDAHAHGGTPRALLLAQPVANLTIRDLLVPSAQPRVVILVDRTREHARSPAHFLRPLDGLELTAAAPHGGHHVVQLDDRGASYARVRMGGQAQACPCDCVLAGKDGGQHGGHFECSPPALRASTLGAELRAHSAWAWAWRATPAQGHALPSQRCAQRSSARPPGSATSARML